MGDKRETKAQARTSGSQLLGTARVSDSGKVHRDRDLNGASKNRCVFSGQTACGVAGEKGLDKLGKRVSGDKHYGARNCWSVWCLDPVLEALARTV